jgi:transposase
MKAGAIRLFKLTTMKPEDVYHAIRHYLNLEYDERHKQKVVSLVEQVAGRLEDSEKYTQLQEQYDNLQAAYDNLVERMRLDNKKIVRYRGYLSRNKEKAATKMEQIANSIAEKICNNYNITMQQLRFDSPDEAYYPFKGKKAVHLLKAREEMVTVSTKCGLSYRFVSKFLGYRRHVTSKFTLQAKRKARAEIEREEKRHLHQEQMQIVAEQLCQTYGITMDELKKQSGRNAKGKIKEVRLRFAYICREKYQISVSRAAVFLGYKPSAIINYTKAMKNLKHIPNDTQLKSVA